jgi:predicted molibdopterin-dependent oxidoreductase YjgC
MALLETEGERGGGVLVLGEKCNVQGVLDVGLHPALLPGHRWADRPEARREVESRWKGLLPGADGWGADRSFREAAEGGVGVLYLAGQDPVITWPRGFEAKAALSRAGFVVVQDTFLTQTARLADAVLPVRILGERAGSLVGADGVRRSLRPVLAPPDDLPRDGEVFAELARRLGAALPSEARLEEELEELVDFRPRRRGGSRRFEPVPPPLRRPAWSGMLLDASPQLFHSGSVTNRSEALEALSPSEAVRVAPADAARLGVANGQMVRVSTGRREVLLRVRLDRTVRPGTLVSLWNRGGGSAAALMVDHGQPTAVEVRRSG